MKKYILLAFLLSVGLASTFAQDVRYNFDKDANFSKFKTYKWVILKNAPEVDNILDKNIKSAINAQLAQRGLTKVDTDEADLFIGYQAGLGQEKQFSSYSSDWGYGGGWYRGGWYGPGGSSITTGQTSTIYTGQLVLDMYDSAHKDLVWRGTVSKTIHPKAKPEKQDKNLNKAAAKLLKNYPPPVNK
jgi:Domain of unknown function (DUF4136)